MPWCDNEGVDADFHKDYLQEIGNTFESALMRLIDHEVDSRQLPVVKGIPRQIIDDVLTEVLGQCHTASKKISFFKGRESLLQRIGTYSSEPSELQKPLIVCGESGSGRTALLAKAAQQVSSLP